MNADSRRRAEADLADAEAALRALQAHAREGRLSEALWPLQDRLRWNQSPAAVQD